MIRTLAALSLALGLPVQAATHIVATATARDFLAGDPKGTSVTSEGKLTLGTPFGPRAWPEDAADAVIFAASSDGSGRVYVATGGGHGRLFAAGPDGKVSLAFVAPEPNLTAVAVASDGTVLCASSPNGKVYRIDRKEADPAKAGVAFVDPKEASIWALAFGPDGTLYVGTGNKGRIYKRGPTGSADLLFATDDTHVRTLLVGPDGTVYAGTSDRGLVVAVAKDGTARTLHDFGKPEVVGLALRADGTLYAAATSAEPPPLATVSIDPKLRAPAPASAPKDEPPKGTVSITTSTSVARPPAPKDAREGSGEIVAIQKDGFVEPAWIFPEETLYAMRLDPKSDSLLVATGPRGRVYSWKDRRVRLEGGTDQKQVVAIPALVGNFAAVTMNTPGVFFPSAKEQKGLYLSAVKDAGRLASFGRLRWDGTVPAGSAAAFSVRSGNTDKPDGSWTAWKSVSADGSATLPSNRYFQWQVELSRGTKGEAPALERVELSYVERNARPYLENVQVLDPGAVLSRGSVSGTAVLTVTNPDENGIYTGLESPKEPAPDPGAAKKLYRKGFRTVTWKGVDPNGDALRYEVEGRREGASSWFLIRKELEDSALSFDTTALPDGRYRFRVTASDRVSNPDGQALAATEETPVAVVDNTPPVLKVESKRTDGNDVELKVSATDALSPLAKAEGAVNADRWRLLVADDGVTDSPRETFTLRIPKPAKGTVLSIRVVDASGNAAAVTVEYPFE